MAAADRGGSRRVTVVPVHPSTAAAEVIVDELVRAGVTDVVLAPGSRSAPLAIEVARAHNRGELTLHVRIDERTAGFLALGIAKVSRNVVPVITTSGTAAANLRPAMEEAWLSGVPLMALTADRPPELRQTGANQTIDQVRLFDGITALSADLEAPAMRRGLVRYWRSTVSRACAVAMHPWQRGPVHINVALRDPLTPNDDDSWVESLSGHDAESFVDEDGDEVQVIRTWTVDRRLMLSVQEPIDEILDDLGFGELPEKGLVIVGDIDDPEDAAAAIELAESCGWPLISEPTGQARAGSVALAHAALLLANEAFAAGHVPDVVVTVGKVGLTRALLQVITTSRIHLHAEPMRTARWPDPTRTSTAIMGGVPAAPSETDVPEASDWLDSWLMADAAATRTIERLLDDADGLTGLHVARELWDYAGPDDLLFLAASRSIRDMETVAKVRGNAPTVIANRGVNGIDGLISTAWGAAIAHQDAGGGRAFAMIGDLAALYDITGATVGRAETRPDLTLVIVDNDGGGIFSSLEQGDRAFDDVFERVFGTPVDVDIAAMLEAAGIPVVTAKESVRDALVAAQAIHGVKAVLCGPVDRLTERRLHEQLHKAAR